MGPQQLLLAITAIAAAFPLPLAQSSSSPEHSDLIRNRDHINEILLKNLPEDEEETRKKIQRESVILHQLREIYQEQIRPIEGQFHYADLKRHIMSDADITAKPIVLLVGPWSSGKSTIINYFLGLEDSMEELYVGAEPTTADFTVLTYGDEYRTAEGIVLATDPTKPFSSMEKFGQIFLEHLLGIEIPSRILKNVTFIDTPGILENRRQQERGYPYNAVLRWLVMRADLIFVVFDPTKLDVGTELESLFKVLKGKESALRIILNKADSMGQQELMRVYGALFWSLSPLINVTEPPRVYVGSFWNKEYRTRELAPLLMREEKSLLLDMREIIRNQVHNKIAFVRQHAIRVRIHALLVDSYVAAYRRNKGIFDGADDLARHVVTNPEHYNVFKTILSHPNVSEYDLPDPDEYIEFFQINPLSELKRVAEICSWTGSNCAFEKMNRAIGVNLPAMLQSYQQEIGEQSCTWKGGYCYPPPEPVLEKVVESKKPASKGKWQKPKSPAEEKPKQSKLKPTKATKNVEKAPKIIAAATDFQATGFKDNARGFEEPELTPKEDQEIDTTGFEEAPGTGFEADSITEENTSEEAETEQVESHKIEEKKSVKEDSESEEDQRDTSEEAITQGDADEKEEESDEKYVQTSNEDEDEDEESDEKQVEQSEEEDDEEDSDEKQAQTSEEEEEESEEQYEEGQESPEDDQEREELQQSEEDDTENVNEESVEETKMSLSVKLDCRYRQSCYTTGVLPDLEELKVVASAPKPPKHNADKDSKEEDEYKKERNMKLFCRYRTSCYETGDQPDVSKLPPPPVVYYDEEEKDEEDVTEREEQMRLKQHCKWRSSCYDSGILPNIEQLKQLAAEAEESEEEEELVDISAVKSELEKKFLCRYRQSCYETGALPDDFGKAVTPLIHTKEENEDEEELSERKAEEAHRLRCKYRTSCYETGEKPDIEALKAAAAEAQSRIVVVSEDAAADISEHQEELNMKLACRYRKSCYDSGVLPDLEALKAEADEAVATPDEEEDDEIESKDPKVRCRYRKTCYETGELPDLDALSQEAAKAVAQSFHDSEEDEEDDSEDPKMKCRYRKTCYETGELPDLDALNKEATEAVAKAPPKSTDDNNEDEESKDPKLQCRYRKSCYETGEVPDLQILQKVALEALLHKTTEEVEDYDDNEHRNELRMKLRCKYRISCYETGEVPDITELQQRAAEAIQKGQKQETEEISGEQSEKTLKFNCKYKKNCYEASGIKVDRNEPIEEDTQESDDADDSQLKDDDTKNEEEEAATEEEEEEIDNVKDDKEETGDAKHEEDDQEDGVTMEPKTESDHQPSKKVDQTDSIKEEEKIEEKENEDEKEIEDEEEEDNEQSEIERRKERERKRKEKKAAKKEEKKHSKTKQKTSKTEAEPAEPKEESSELKPEPLKAAPEPEKTIPQPTKPSKTIPKEEPKSEEVHTEAEDELRTEKAKLKLSCKYRKNCYDTGKAPDIAQLNREAAAALESPVIQINEEEDEDEWKAELRKRLRCRYRKTCYDTGEVPDLQLLAEVANEAIENAEEEEDEDQSERDREYNQHLKCKYRKNCYETGEAPNIEELQKMAAEAEQEAEEEEEEDDDERKQAMKQKLKCKYRSSCYETGEVPDIDELKALALEASLKIAETEDEESEDDGEHSKALRLKLKCRYRSSCYETGELPDLVQLTAKAHEAKAADTVEDGEDEEEDEWKQAQKQKLKCLYRASCYDTGKVPDIKALNALANEAAQSEHDEEPDFSEIASELAKKVHCRYRTSCYETGIVPEIQMVVPVHQHVATPDEVKEMSIEEKCKYRKSCYETGILPDINALIRKAQSAKSADAQDDEEEGDERNKLQRMKQKCKFKKTCYEPEEDSNQDETEPEEIAPIPEPKEINKRKEKKQKREVEKEEETQVEPEEKPKEPEEIAEIKQEREEEPKVIEPTDEASESMEESEKNDPSAKEIPEVEQGTEEEPNEIEPSEEPSEKIEESEKEDPSVKEAEEDSSREEEIPEVTCVFPKDRFKKACKAQYEQFQALTEKRQEKTPPPPTTAEPFDLAKCTRNRYRKSCQSILEAAEAEEPTETIAPSPISQQPPPEPFDLARCSRNRYRKSCAPLLDAEETAADSSPAASGDESIPSTHLHNDSERCHKWKKSCKDPNAPPPRPPSGGKQKLYCPKKKPAKEPPFKKSKASKDSTAQSGSLKR